MKFELNENQYKILRLALRTNVDNLKEIANQEYLAENYSEAKDILKEMFSVVDVLDTLEKTKE